MLARVYCSLPAQAAQREFYRMNRYNLLFATIAATFVAGCASVTTQPSGPQDDKSYVTGSRLPAREGGTSASVKAIENKQGIDDMMQRGSVIGSPPKGGGM
jgi:hypothetical protein